MPRDDGYPPDPDEVAPDDGGYEPEDAESVADDEDGDDEPPRGPFDGDEPEPDGDDEDAGPPEASDDDGSAEEIDVEELKAKAAAAEKWEAYYRNQQQQQALREAQERWAQQEREADAYYDALMAKVEEEAEQSADPRAYRRQHARAVENARVTWHKRFEASKFAKREEAIARLQVPLYAEDVAVHWQIPRKYIPEMVARAKGNPHLFNEEAERLRRFIDELDAKDAELDQLRRAAKAREIAGKRVGPGQGRPSGGSKPGTRGQLFDLWAQAGER